VAEFRDRNGLFAQGDGVLLMRATAGGASLGSMTIFFATVTVIAALLVVFLVMRNRGQS
jgi:hypothetical protein